MMQSRKNARIKRWIRQRYPNIQLSKNKPDDDGNQLQTEDLLDLYEYAHYINMGDSMQAVMNTLRKVCGKCRRLEITM